MGKKTELLREGERLREAAQPKNGPGGADKAREIKRYDGLCQYRFKSDISFVCIDALAGRITHSSKLERLIRRYAPLLCILGWCETRRGAVAPLQRRWG